MVIEVIVICITIYAIFGNYFLSRAELNHELAREKELDNDEREMNR